MFIYSPPEGYIADLVTEETVRRKERDKAEYEQLCKFVERWNKEPLTTEDVPSATEPRSAKIPGKGSEPGAKGSECCPPEPNWPSEGRPKSC